MTEQQLSQIRKFKIGDKAFIVNYWQEPAKTAMQEYEVVSLISGSYMGKDDGIKLQKANLPSTAFLVRVHDDAFMRLATTNTKAIAIFKDAETKRIAKLTEQVSTATTNLEKILNKLNNKETN